MCQRRTLILKSPIHSSQGFQGRTFKISTVVKENIYGRIPHIQSECHGKPSMSKFLIYSQCFKEKHLW